MKSIMIYDFKKSLHEAVMAQRKTKRSVNFRHSLRNVSKIRGNGVS